ncbi:MAG: hypothetical protein IIY77_08905, partial [Lachnospiraceae bacterium]|nr:hypothetical protein [Lachnospiraceae bacterium]
MNRTVIKNILREIIKNPGRFLAVLGIIMLGSGFFVGLRITREAMLKTASEFLNEGSFYDYKLISTVGFSKDADEELETARIHPDSGTGQKGSGNPTGVSTDQNSVLLAEGGMEQDAFVYLPGRDDSVMHFMSLPEKINRPRVVQGRLPENPGEILLDVNASGSYHIGDEAELSEENDDKTLEAFSTRTFVVTGFAVSPLYLNYERGSSSLGTGSVSSFAYILPEDFTADYDTAVYIKLPGTEDIDLYDEQYEELAEPYEAPVKEQAEKLADKRFAALLKENREKLEENEETYQDGLKEYKEQEKKARKELKDAKKQLEDGKKLLDENEEAYQKGLLEFDQKKKEAEAAMKEAEDKLLQSSKELSDGEKAYGEGLAAYKEGEAAYTAGIQELASRSEQAATLLSFYTLYTDFRNAFSDTGSVLSKMLLDIAAANTMEKDGKPSDSTSDKDKDQGKDSGQKTGPGDSGKKTGPDDSGKKTDDEDPGQKTGPDDQETAEERRERIAEIYRQNRDALQENLTALTKAAEALADEA